MSVNTSVPISLCKHAHLLTSNQPTCTVDMREVGFVHALGRRFTDLGLPGRSSDRVPCCSSACEMLHRNPRLTTPSWTLAHRDSGLTSMTCRDGARRLNCRTPGSERWLSFDCSGIQVSDGRHSPVSPIIEATGTPSSMPSFFIL
jgi:hypothetical protein